MTAFLLGSVLLAICCAVMMADYFEVVTIDQWAASTTMWLAGLGFVCYLGGAVWVWVVVR